MLFIPIKASAFAVLIVITMAGTFSVSAQTNAISNNSTAKPVSVSKTTEPGGEQKSETPVVRPDSTNRPEATANDDRDAARSDPVMVPPGKELAADGEREPARKTVPASPQSRSADEWHFQASPYFWLAGLHGNAGVGNRTTQVDEQFSNIFHSLNFAIMGTFEARKGKFISLTDIEYVDVSDDKATPGPLFSNVNAKFKTFIFDPEVGYRLFADEEKGASVDVLGGIRVWHVSTDLAFGSGILPAVEVQASRNWVDGIAGLRGKAALSKKFFVTGKFDLGGGGSNFTYQIFGGGGYSVNERLALILGYRVLDVNYNKNNFIYDVSQRGPIMGLGFRF